MPRTLAEAATWSGTPLPQLVTVTQAPTSPAVQYLFMSTNNTSMTTNESLFFAPDGTLVFKVVNKEGVFSGSKVLSNAAGTPLLRCKKSPLSRAKWTITCATSGAELCKTKTNPGLAKIAVEAAFPGRRETLTAVPNFNDLSRMVMWQTSGKGEAQESPLAEAAYGQNVVIGMISTLVQNWTYNLALAPGADPALVAVLLCIYTDLVEFNSMNAMVGGGIML